MTYTYLASPYSHPEASVCERRYLATMRCVRWLVERGDWTFSPLLHCHEMAHRFHLPTDHIYWSSFNRAMLLPSTRLLILTLDGWKDSKGIADETIIAHETGKPINFIAPTTFAITEE